MSENELNKTRAKLLQQRAKQHMRNKEVRQALLLLEESNNLFPQESVVVKIKALQDILKKYAPSENSTDPEGGVAFVPGLTEQDKPFSIRRKLYEKLYPYQIDGVKWLFTLYRDRRKGGVLADDMGMGKTIQVVAYLSGLYDNGQDRSTLIVLPMSLIMTWMGEFARWAPQLRVFNYHSASNAERNRIHDYVFRHCGIVLISYGMLVSGIEQLMDYQGYPYKWSNLILDEGHKIKNVSKTTAAVMKVDADLRLVLTGTAIQNNLEELWALYNFTHRGTLLESRYHFKRYIQESIEKSRRKDATESQRAIGVKLAQDLMETIKPYFLRRTKAQELCHVTQTSPDMTSLAPLATGSVVASLSGDADVRLNFSSSAAESSEQNSSAANISNNMTSPSRTSTSDLTKKSPDLRLTARKNDLVLWVYLSDDQERIYRDFLASPEVKRIFLRKHIYPLVELTVMKKICDHPRLLPKLSLQKFGINRNIEPDVLDAKIDAEHVDIENVDECDLIRESGKLRVLLPLLLNLKENGHRVLMFSLSLKILTIIERLLASNGLSTLRLDGSVKMMERAEICSKFQSGLVDCLLLTTQVGGVGLTLTAANRVIIYDPHWNPAVDAQAVDRAYRIGQHRDVVVYRLITCGTIEEKIYRRQIFKESIIKQTVDKHRDPHRYFSHQELSELFAFDSARISTTQVQLEQLHSQERKTTPELEAHIAYLRNLAIFGVSHHDLMFSKVIEVSRDVTPVEATQVCRTWQSARISAAAQRSTLTGNNNNDDENGVYDDDDAYNDDDDDDDDENGNQNGGAIDVAAKVVVGSSNQLSSSNDNVVSSSNNSASVDSVLSGDHCYMMHSVAVGAVHLRVAGEDVDAGNTVSDADKTVSDTEKQKSDAVKMNSDAAEMKSDEASVSDNAISTTNVDTVVTTDAGSNPILEDDEMFYFAGSSQPTGNSTGFSSAVHEECVVAITNSVQEDGFDQNCDQTSSEGAIAINNSAVSLKRGGCTTSSVPVRTHRAVQDFAAGPSRCAASSVPVRTRRALQYLAAGPSRCAARSVPVRTGRVLQDAGVGPSRYASSGVPVKTCKILNKVVAGSSGWATRSVPVKTCRVLQDVAAGPSGYATSSVPVRTCRLLQDAGAGPSGITSTNVDGTTINNSTIGTDGNNKLVTSVKTEPQDSVEVDGDQSRRCKKRKRCPVFSSEVIVLDSSDEEPLPKCAPSSNQSGCYNNISDSDSDCVIVADSNVEKALISCKQEFPLQQPSSSTQSLNNCSGTVPESSQNLTRGKQKNKSHSAVVSGSSVNSGNTVVVKQEPSSDVQGTTTVTMKISVDVGDKIPSANTGADDVTKIRSMMTRRTRSSGMSVKVVQSSDNSGGKLGKMSADSGVLSNVSIATRLRVNVDKTDKQRADQKRSSLTSSTKLPSCRVVNNSSWSASQMLSSNRCVSNCDETMESIDDSAALQSCDRVVNNDSVASSVSSVSGDNVLSPENVSSNTDARDNDVFRSKSTSVLPEPEVESAVNNPESDVTTSMLEEESVGKSDICDNSKVVEKEANCQSSDFLDDDNLISEDAANEEMELEPLYETNADNVREISSLDFSDDDDLPCLENVLKASSSTTMETGHDDLDSAMEQSVSQEDTSHLASTSADSDDNDTRDLLSQRNAAGVDSGSYTRSDFEAVESDAVTQCAVAAEEIERTAATVKTEKGATVVESGSASAAAIKVKCEPIDYAPSSRTSMLSSYSWMNGDQSARRKISSATITKRSIPLLFIDYYASDASLYDIPPFVAALQSHGACVVARQSEAESKMATLFLAPDNHDGASSSQGCQNDK